MAAGPGAADGGDAGDGDGLQWDPNLNANENLARAFFAMAGATQAAQRRQDRRQADELLYGKANKEAPTLTAVTPVEKVLDFFNEFEIVAMTNRWSDQRARLELRSAMKGDVAQTIMGIPVGHDVNPAQPWRYLSQQYLNAIITPAAQAGLKANLRLLKQREKESLAAWKARLMTMYNYAYRDMFLAHNLTAANYPPVKDHFINGLANQVVMSKLRDLQPLDLNAALGLAEGLQGAQKEQQAVQWGGRRGGGRYFLNQVEADGDKDKDKETRTCYECGLKGHIARNCRKGTSNAGGNNNGRGGRGRGRGGRGRGGTNRYNPTRTNNANNRGRRSGQWSTSANYSVAEANPDRDTDSQEEVEWTEEPETTSTNQGN